MIIEPQDPRPPQTSASAPPPAQKKRPYKGFRFFKDLPNATVIYGLGSSLFFIAAFSLLSRRLWFASFLVLLIGACLAGFAHYFLKHQE